MTMVDTRGPDPAGPIENIVFKLADSKLFSRSQMRLLALPDGWARIRFSYCGICGSDISCFEGRRKIAYPRSLGHEFVGRVEAVGDGVTSFKPGDVVTSDLNFRCGQCAQCSRGRSHLCEQGQQGLFTNRAFAEMGDFHVSYLYLVPHSEPHARFALTEPLSCVLHALDWLSLDDRSQTLVVGGGSLGLCAAIAFERSSDRGDFDLLERVAPRRSRLAAAMGRGRVVDTVARSYETVLDLSGTSAGLGIAVDRVANGGRLCTLSHLEGQGGGSFLAERLQRRDVTFKLSYLNGPATMMNEAIECLAQNWSAAWHECLSFSPVTAIQDVFERRAGSAANKDILVIDLSLPAQ